MNSIYQKTLSKKINFDGINIPFNDTNNYYQIIYVFGKNCQLIIALITRKREYKTPFLKEMFYLIELNFGFLFSGMNLSNLTVSIPSFISAFFTIISSDNVNFLTKDLKDIP